MKIFFSIAEKADKHIEQNKTKLQRTSDSKILKPWQSFPFDKLLSSEGDNGCYGWLVLKFMFLFSIKLEEIKNLDCTKLQGNKENSE